MAVHRSGEPTPLDGAPRCGALGQRGSMRLDENKSAAVKLAALYVFAGSVWIVLSNAFARAMPGQSDGGSRALPWQTWLFLGGTGLLLIPLVRRQLQHASQRDSRLRQAQEALRAIEAQSRAILENAADGIIAADGSGVITLFNPAAAGIFGYSPSEIMGANIKTLIPRPYLREHESYRLKPASAEEKPKVVSMGREVIGRRKNGDSFPVELAVSEVSEGPQRLFIAVVRDITERKRAEHELTRSREQLRSLAAKLQSIREEERTRISREIHDELGQALTGVKMDLAWMTNRFADDQVPLTERSKSMARLIDGTIQTVRKIATELRPGILDNLGLVAALEWQAAEFATRTGIACHCVADPNFPEPPPAHGTALFRIFQETLTNVARHSQASRVEVDLTQADDHIVLQVSDNGRGITPDELAGSTSLGLLGIRERARMLGGAVSILGRPGQGTSLTVTVPQSSTPQLVSAS